MWLEWLDRLTILLLDLIEFAFVTAMVLMAFALAFHMLSAILGSLGFPLEDLSKLFKILLERFLTFLKMLGKSFYKSTESTEKVLKTLGKSLYKSTYLVEVDERRMVKVEYVKPELALRGLGYWLQLRDVPGVARLVKFEGNTFYREYVEGESLREILIKRGALSPREVCSVALGIAGILEEVHSRGFIHCDLKPENVIVRDLGKGDVILIDWEFTARDGEEPITLPRTAIYTPSGASRASRGIDIYAFCVMIDEMMWGRPFPTVRPTSALEEAFVELVNKCFKATSMGEVKRMLEEVCRKI